MQHHNYREKLFSREKPYSNFPSYRNYLKQTLLFLLLFYEVLKKFGVFTTLVSDVLPDQQYLNSLM